MAGLFPDLAVWLAAVPVIVNGHSGYLGFYIWSDVFFIGQSRNTCRAEEKSQSRKKARVSYDLRTLIPDDILKIYYAPELELHILTLKQNKQLTLGLPVQIIGKVNLWHELPL